MIVAILKYAILSVTISVVFGETLIRQCTCEEVNRCKKDAYDQLIPCADKCRQYATKMGANYTLLRQCVLKHRERIEKTVRCTEQTVLDACARGKPEMVKPFRLSDLKISAYVEINSLLSKAGIVGQVKHLLVVGRNFFGCMRKCIERKTEDSCEDPTECGLKLPNTNVLVNNVKRCALQNGFDTKTVQEICRCGLNAGLIQLEGVCERATVNENMK
ncbi:hypothetical protein AB6A40_002227 [Gnathostoma spinigerum]|uniref:Uncharacterized protein n=1 Tax=Gnathostoma spinigerum TaxID=75299 RepID=A0ABD6E617_9BILA